MSKLLDISTADAFLRAKLEALAEFAAGAGHEINNPVATIVGRTELLLKGETNPERRQALLTIGAQALRIRDMIGDLMVYARPPQPQPESLNLVEVVNEVVLKLDESLRAKKNDRTSARRAVSQNPRGSGAVTSGHQQSAAQQFECLGPRWINHRRMFKSRG